MLEYVDVLLFAAALPICCYLVTCCQPAELKAAVSAKLKHRKGYYTVALDDLADQDLDEVRSPPRPAPRS